MTTAAEFIANYRYYCQACLKPMRHDQFVFCAECEAKYSPYF